MIGRLFGVTRLVGTVLSSGSGAAPAFDPATLSLSAWYRASYGGSPWTPVASAGSSSSNGNATEATNPPAVGSALGAYTPASFDGTNDQLANANALSTFIGATPSAWTVLALVNVTSLPIDNAVFDEDPIVADSGGYWGMHLGTSGMRAYVFDTGARATAHTPVSTGTWTLLKMKQAGGNLYAGKNGGAWTTGVAAGNVNASGLSSTLRLGRNYASAFTNMELAEVMIAASELTDDNITSVISYVNARYGLSLT